VAATVAIVKPSSIVEAISIVFKREVPTASIIELVRRITEVGPCNILLLTRPLIWLELPL